jgi:hypothetical protein
MFTYVCCRCTNCAARVVLEEWTEPGMYLLHRPSRPRAGREACPYCRSVFPAEQYYITESASPLTAAASLRNLKDSTHVFTETA